MDAGKSLVTAEYEILGFTGLWTMLSNRLLGGSRRIETR